MKKGFTLIELLAVIVILAIIALIATPIVLNIINDSRESSTLRSVDFYLDAVEYSVASFVIEEGAIDNGTYSIMKNGNLCIGTLLESGSCTGKELKVELNGEKPNSGTIKIEGGKTKEVSINLNNKVVVKNEKGELDYKEEESDLTPVPSKICTANTVKARAFVYKTMDPSDLSNYEHNQEVGLLASTDGAYTPGVSYTCNFIDNNEINNITFYVLASTENEVTLIAGYNIGGLSDWSEDGSNHKNESEDKQAVTAKAALADRTKLWSIENGGKLNDTQMASIKLPSAYQIAEVVGQTFSNSLIDELPTWLTSSTIAESLSFGYWTSTFDANSSFFVWAIYVNGNLSNGSGVDSGYGIRPVITLSKSEL